MKLLATTATLLIALSATADAKPLTIRVLSGRADLVSGGDALVKIGGATTTKGLRVRAGGKDQSAAFRARRGVVRGLVTGLPLGRSTIRVRQGGQAAKIAVRNHPLGGPVFAGPQLQPWTCQEGAQDAQCNQPPKFEYLYKSTDSNQSGLQPYDPDHPATDVATTKTERGVTVPFIVRVETGYIDRDQYKIAALFQPGKPWTGTRPQRQFGHKLLITHGAGCGIDYKTGGAPGVTGGAAETALSRGWATMSNALDNSGHHCNIAVQAESLVMTKEYLVERYGALRYTIGTGCSGGSLAEQWIANAYPGVYQGILPTCSFPDAWGTATQFLDYHLTLAYFTDPSRWGPGVVWSPTQMADVQGHVSIVNSEVSDTAQFHVVVPTDPCAGVTDQQRYEPKTNPGGVRCSILDASINVFGPRAPEVWSAQEKQIGHGFAGIPVDNVGVQYGLSVLRSGTILPEQFLDLNEKIGGLDIDINPTPSRITADRPALANAYRSGSINETNNLNRTAIIDCRGPDPGLFHDAYRAFAVRARLDREHGNHANQLIWEGPSPITADSACEQNSFDAMDRWLAAVQKDRKPGTVAQKIVRDKPADLTDRCYDGGGHKLLDDLCGEAVVPIYGTPRTVAGDALSTDTNKCRLKPLKRDDDYGPLGFSDAQWARMQKLYPDGVCDFTKPGVDQQGTIPWQTYQRADGDVIYGGRRLGKAPRSRAVRRRR